MVQTFVLPFCAWTQASVDIGVVGVAGDWRLVTDFPQADSGGAGGSGSRGPMSRRNGG